MRLRWLLALAVCSCTAAPVPPPPLPTVPPDLQSCPPAPRAVPVPKPPRTWDVVIAYGNASDRRRADTLQALEVCRAKLIKLLEWIDDLKSR
jgi:hypothetical protein